MGDEVGPIPEGERVPGGARAVLEAAKAAVAAKPSEVGLRAMTETVAAAASRSAPTALGFSFSQSTAWALYFSNPGAPGPQVCVAAKALECAPLVSRARDRWVDDGPAPLAFEVAPLAGSRGRRRGAQPFVRPPSHGGATPAAETALARPWPR